MKASALWKDLDAATKKRYNDQYAAGKEKWMVSVRESVTLACTPLCRLCGRLDNLISEPTMAVGATVTAGTVILIGLPRMAR